MIRFNQLALTHIGGFQERQFDFAQDRTVHVFYGSNEAGKSTLLRAFTNMLYGFPPSKDQRDAYLFSGRPQRICLNGLVNSQPFSLTRQASSKQSLTSNNGELPSFIDPKTLHPSGYSRAQFMTLLGMNQQSLRSGGQQILQGDKVKQGDRGEKGLGAALYSAGTGIEDVEQRLKALEDECEALFPVSGRGSKSLILQKMTALEAARKELKQSDLQYSDLSSHEDRQRTLTREIEGIEAQLNELRDIEKRSSERAFLTKELEKRDAELTSLSEQAAVKVAAAKQAWQLAGLSGQAQDEAGLALALPALETLARELSEASKELRWQEEKQVDDAESAKLPGDLSAFDALDGADQITRSALDAARELHDVEQRLAEELARWSLDINDLLDGKTPPERDALSQILDQRDRLRDEQAAINSRLENALDRSKSLEQSLSKAYAGATSAKALRGSRDELRGQRDKALADLIATSAPSGNELRAQLVEIDRLAREADKQADDLASALTVLAEMDRQEAELTNVHATLEQQGKALEQAKERHHKLKTEWQALWRANDLPPVDPDEITRFFEGWQRARDLFATRAKAVVEQERAASHCSQLWHRIEGLLNRWDEALPPVFSPENFDEQPAPQALAQLCQQLQRWRDDRAAQEQQLAEARIERESLEKTVTTRLKRWNEEARALLLPASRSAIHVPQVMETVKAALAAASEANREQDAKTRAAADLDQARKALSELPSDEQLNDESALEARVQQLEGQRRSLTERRATAAQEFEGKLMAKRPAQLRAEINRLEADIAELAQLYANKRAAKEMLEAALNNARLSGNEVVVERASHYFSTLTDGRYNRLEVGEQSLSGWLAINERDQLEVPVAKLSDGTGDQLFLALRLAFLARQAPMHRLPMILDDALTDFDDGRTAKAFELFAELENRQVIYFTHHERTAQIAVEHANADLIEI